MSDRPDTSLRELVRGGVEALLEEGKYVRDRLAANAAARERTKPSAGELLLMKRERKRRRLRSHTHSFVSVILGLAVINVITGLASGAFFPWVLLVAASWGMGLSMHAMGFRSWVQDHERALVAAEAELGVSPPPQLPPLQRGRPPVSGDPAWEALLARCRAAVTSAQAALADAGSDRDTIERLRSGLTDVEHLAAGAEKVRRALAEIAPEGASLDGEIARLDGRINAADDERLRGVYLANRTLLQARKAKVTALRAERERMAASAEGFLLAVENVRLDAARIGAGHVPALSAALGDTLDRLSTEVSILRQVEEELETL
ncbi:MAG: hypothetical protein AMXMBFR64_47290 [Myxococcales bacterium]